MMKNKKIFYLTLLMFFSINCAFLFAEEGTKRYFVQKLEWEEDPNALEYKLEIQSLEKKSLSKTVVTKDTFFEFSMPAGLYQYRVFAYDFLGRQASVTEWKQFTITKAVAPEIQLEKDTIEIPHKKEKELVVPVDIEQIESDASIVFVNVETDEKVEGRLDVETDEEGNVKSSKAVFPGATTGKWKLVITNPSGLSSESEPVTMEKTQKEPVVRDFNIMVTGLTSLLFSGETKDNVEYGDAEPTNLIGFGFGISHLPLKVGNFKLGYEAKFSYFSRDYQTDYYNLSCHFNNFDLGFVLRYNFADNKFGVNARVGSGITLITESVSYGSSLLLAEHDPISFGYVNVNGGVSINWIPFKHFIMELGLNLTDVLMEEENLFILVPFVSAGFRF